MSVQWPRNRRLQGGQAIPLMPRHVPNDVMSWLQDRQAEQRNALTMGDLHHVTELFQAMSEGVKHLTETFQCSHLLWPMWSRKDVFCRNRNSSSRVRVHCAIHFRRPQAIARIVEHRCGMQSVRVGEASNPSPPRRLLLRFCEGEGGGSEDQPKPGCHLWEYKMSSP